jgi:cellulose synthase/poly-beta-1,6-N-acetylglucosamine synthase-like glycosyltransferase
VQCDDRFGSDRRSTIRSAAGWDILEDGFTYLGAQSWQSLIALFWFVILFELPRYSLTYITAGLLLPFQKSYGPPKKRPKVSAVVAGHNEADVIKRCVLALHEQSWAPDEIIIVSDGSTDAMAARLRQLRQRDLITEVPETFKAFIRQRFRWERDTIRLRYRKHADLVNPFSNRLKPLELVHELEFLGFDIFAAVAMPIYPIWLFTTYGDLAPAILMAAQTGLLIPDFVTISLAALATPRVLSLRHLLSMPAYSLLNSYYMRFVRLAAYFQEWIFQASYRDSYVPSKVLQQRY